MAEYDNEMSGVAFFNDYKKLPKHPSFRGTLQINGVTYKQAVWEKVSKNGKKMLTFSYEPETNAPKPETKPAEIESYAEEIDDEIPF